MSVVNRTESIESYVHRVPIARGISGPNGVEPEVSEGAMLVSAGPEQPDAAVRTAAIVAKHAIASLRQEVTVLGSGTTPESSSEN